MSGVKVGGAWKTPGQTFVRVAGVWKQAATVHCKVAGVWKLTDFAAPPAVPVLSYSADGVFTITNYDAGLTYAVSGATRTGASLSSVSNGATITAAYSGSAPASAARTMNVAAHARVLDSLAGSYSDAGCGTRPGTYCPGGQISDTAGNTYSGVGTAGDFCGGSCPGNCYGYFNFPCYNWHWTDYSGSGYTLIGNTWGKAS